MQLTFGRYGGGRGEGGAGELLWAMEVAVKRWRAATGLLINLSVDGPHFIRWKPGEDMPSNSSGFTTGSFETGVRIFINEQLAAHRVVPVLMHEMCHVFRKSYGHSDEDGSMAYPVTHVDSEPKTVITAGDIALVDAVLGCPISVPER